MPTYCHQCTNVECAHEWEEIYSISADPPTTCPKCNQETAKRVISSATPGTVELVGQDLVDKVKQETADLKKNMSRNDNVYANMLGDSRYHSIQTQLDKKKKR